MFSFFLLLQGQNIYIFLHLMNSAMKLPAYAKFALILIGIYVFVNILHTLGGIVVPLLYAVIFAILINPLVSFFENRRVTRVLSITIAVLIALIFVGSIFYFIVGQITGLSSILPELNKRL